MNCVFCVSVHALIKGNEGAILFLCVHFTIAVEGTFEEKKLSK